MEKYKFSAEKQQMLESMTIPLAVFQYVNNKIETLVVSEGFRDMFGYETLKDTYYDMENDMYKYDHPDDIARIADAALRFAVDGGTFDIIYRTKERSGSGYRIVHAKGKHVFETPDARVSYIYYTDEGFYAKDEGNHTTDFARSLNNALHEESILKANYYDFLTGLPSMTYFFELASASKERILENGGNPALLYMDFGGMKFFNSKHGFAEGDKMLKSFAGLLKEMFGNENCCRIGSDHFAVVTEKALAEEQLETLFKKCEQMNEGKNLPLHVGIYHAQMNPVHVSAACDRARLACNALKGSYASGFNYYSQEISDSVEKKQYIVEHLDQAIAEKWIKVYYQPIVRAVNGRVCGEEALARWIDPDKGFLSPADFIPFLEEAGLIYKLDLFVLEQILEKLKNQKKAGLTAIPHSINLSRVDFDSCDIVEEIRRRVDDSGVSRSLITIEITESVIGSDFEYMKNLVDRFRANGFEVWMDDFGSGYSSLDVLQSVQFDLIKFDMSFMRKLEEGNSGKIILTELMKMATSLGLETVCEGVETESQARFLQEIGCSMLQGYYYCRPISYEQLLERYQKGEQIGYENPAEASYYEAIGQVNLYDLSVIAGNNEDSFQNSFNTLPMGIIEIQDDESRFVRCNQSYRDFIKR
ncbi:MAG: EAL domain-containing protein, partial [Parasporobacterium sp.]|nr:EAL domain-containing protein [Parasporobacterium sp.]